MTKESTRVLKRIALSTMSLMSTAALLSVDAAAAPADQASEGAPQSDSIGGLEEIVVTAQKRTESINDVGMSINAISGDQLLDRGVMSVADLAKVVPGFNFTSTLYSTPVYTIRGVGFQENSLAASPAVSVYVDEIPIPFSIESVAAALDLERVEVLKGPQGTLYGMNSTGGAVNYIAAKPTDSFAAGVNASYGRFNTADVSGFVSGPLTDTLKARLAARFVTADDWQRSYSRSDELGQREEMQARMLLDWQPTEALKVAVNINGWRDRSDTPAAQYIALNPAAPLVGVSPELAAFPFANTDDARVADWNDDISLRRNNRFYQASVRLDYSLRDDLTLSSISSYQRYRRDQPLDNDGTPLQAFGLEMDGNIRTRFQELRLSSGAADDRMHWIIGANYQADDVVDNALLLISDSSNRFIAGFPITSVTQKANQEVTTKAVYGNIDYEILPALSIVAGVRYTESEHRFAGCGADPGDNSVAALFNGLRAAFTGSPDPQIGPGDCFTLDQNFQSVLFRDTLDDSNTSWRLGLNFTPVDDILFYGTVSKGFKAGSFPTLTGTSSAQYEPVTQESVVAYELGMKATLLERTLQLNAAAFYYDYQDKQIRGRLDDPIFGALESLINIPKSHVTGFEVGGIWEPVHGLTIAPSVTLVKSQIDGDFSNFDLLGNFVRLSGESFPYTPEWSGNVDVEYRWGLTTNWDAYVGGNVSYQDDTNGGFSELPLFGVDSYTLLDLRAGIESGDSRWRVGVWGTNVTDEYYWSTATQLIDTAVRYAGMPRMYGISFGYRFE